MPKLGLFSSGWLPGETVQFGASDFWRLAVPGRELSRHGWTVVPGRELRSAASGVIVLRDEHGHFHDDCEILLLQRWMGVGMPEAIERARAAGQFVVQDLDDNFWSIPRGHSARYYTDPKRNPTYNREIYRRALAASSLITVSTPYLAKLVERWGPPVTVVRNFISLDQWREQAPGPHIGWVGAIPWRGADLQLLAPTVTPWLRSRGLPFYHGGHMNEQRRSAKELIGYENVTVRPATDIPNYPKLFDPLGVSLVPIENSSFGLAKSWVKGLESAARGVPVIASKHPEYEALGVARIVRRPRDWAEHLDELEDPAVRASEGAANRARAAELSIERNWHEWSDALSGRTVEQEVA